MDKYDIEFISEIDASRKHLIPPLAIRQSLRVGQIARLCVLVSGKSHIFPFVEVVEVKSPGCYVGEVGGIMDSPDWLPFGTLVKFTADQVVDTGD